MTAPDETGSRGEDPRTEEMALRGQPVMRTGLADLRRIRLDRMRPRSDQPRRRMDDRALDELARSIRAHGVLQPVRVRPHGDGYEIIAGERRWRAARAAGLEEIPAIVVDSDDDRAYIEALIENVQREELNAVDRAHALKRLRLTLNLRSWQEVGDLVGITRQHVYNLLNVTRLPQPIRDDIRAGDLTEKHARALGRLQHHPEEQMRLWARIHAESLSGRAADEVARSMVAQLSARAPRARGTPGDLDTLIDGVMSALAGAGAAELQAAQPALNDLHRRLSHALERQTDRDEPPEVRR
jgi:ParB family transcriptional regulator, chromosome partitioning protein